MDGVGRSTNFTSDWDGDCDFYGDDINICTPRFTHKKCVAGVPVYSTEYGDDLGCSGCTDILYALIGIMAAILLVVTVLILSLLLYKKASALLENAHP